MGGLENKSQVASDHVYKAYLKGKETVYFQALFLSSYYTFADNSNICPNSSGPLPFGQGDSTCVDVYSH